MKKTEAAEQEATLEFNTASRSYRDYLGERVTDDRQFGFEVEYARSTLFERISDVLGRHALFGLFLAGFRAGRKFEVNSPDAPPRITNLAVDVQEVAGYCDVPQEGGLMVFSPSLLRKFAERLLYRVAGQSVSLKEFPSASGEPEVVEASVPALVERRLEVIAQSLSAPEAATDVSQKKREALARHLWTIDQKRTHGEVIGKWEDVSARYRLELQREADALLRAVVAIDQACRKVE